MFTSSSKNVSSKLNMVLSSTFNIRNISIISKFPSKKKKSKRNLSYILCYILFCAQLQLDSYTQVSPVLTSKPQMWCYKHCRRWMCNTVEMEKNTHCRVPESNTGAENNMYIFMFAYLLSVSENHNLFRFIFFKNRSTNCAQKSLVNLL